jgi:hypothetical protein
VEEPQEVIEGAFAVGFDESAIVNWEREAQSVLNVIPINSNNAMRRPHNLCELGKRICKARVHGLPRSSAKWRKRDSEYGSFALPS